LFTVHGQEHVEIAEYHKSHSCTNMYSVYIDT